jgi:hypothetical protein
MDLEATSAIALITEIGWRALPLAHNETLSVVAMCISNAYYSPRARHC